MKTTKMSINVSKNFTVVLLSDWHGLCSCANHTPTLIFIVPYVLVRVRHYACVVADQWGDAGVCPGGLKGMQVARSAICRAMILEPYLTTCSIEFKTPHTNANTLDHTDARKAGGQGWNILLITLTLSPGGWDLDTMTIHLTTWPWDKHALLPRQIDAHMHICIPILFSMPISKAVLWLMCSKCAYFKSIALK